MTVNKNISRIIYAVLALILFLTEVYIALYVRDDFIRPYVGDMLVTLLLGAFIRVIIPDRFRLLPVYVFLFSAFVEVAQYIDVVKLVGLEDNKIISTIVGRSFSFYDVLCYAVGCVALFLVDFIIAYFGKKSNDFK